MDSTCVNSVLCVACSRNISRSKRASPGLSSTRRSLLIGFSVIDVIDVAATCTLSAENHGYGSHFQNVQPDHGPFREAPRPRVRRARLDTASFLRCFLGHEAVGKIQAWTGRPRLWLSAQYRRES